jgi:hypothetical protein
VDRPRKQRITRLLRAPLDYHAGMGGKNSNDKSRYDLEKLRSVIRSLEDFIRSQEPYLSDEYRETYGFSYKNVAARAYPDSTSEGGQKRKFSTFIQERIWGKKPLDGKEIDEVLGGFFSLANDALYYRDGNERPRENHPELKGYVDKMARMHDLPSGELESGHFLRTPSVHYKSTPALIAHNLNALRQRADDLRKLSDELFKLSPEGADVALLKRAGVEIIDAKSRHGVATNLNRFEILSDSFLMDASDWCPVKHVNDIKRRAIQPAYSTRVLTVRPNGKDTEVVIEMNTAGLGVLPCIVEGSTPYSRASLRLVRMDEPEILEHKQTRTTFIHYKIPLAGKAVSIVCHSIFFNGLQDQVHAKDRRGNPCEFDWIGKRIFPGHGTYDLALILPGDRRADKRKFQMREETEADQDIPLEPNNRDRIFDPAVVLDGSITLGGILVWKIPPVRHVQTVFSLKWSWLEEFQGP